MERLKYRIWDIEEDEMLEVLCIDFQGILTDASFVPKVIAGVNGEYKKIELEKAYIMQYTGVKDNFDEEIFQDDIIYDRDTLYCYTVGYCDGCFECYCTSKDAPIEIRVVPLFRMKNFEKIGNTYENQDLLDEE